MPISQISYPSQDMLPAQEYSLVYGFGEASYKFNSLSQRAYHRRTRVCKYIHPQYTKSFALRLLHGIESRGHSAATVFGMSRAEINIMTLCSVSAYHCTGRWYTFAYGKGLSYQVWTPPKRFPAKKQKLRIMWY
jgi:hypothetical protein